MPAKFDAATFENFSIAPNKEFNPTLALALEEAMHFVDLRHD